MKKYMLIPFCLILGFSCKQEPPVEPPGQPTIVLKAEDASCIEAWLRVTTADIPATVRLLRDGQPVSVLGLRSSDSLMIDEGLLPKRTYTYQLQKLATDSSVIETSASVQVTTMDTTSHNFTWRVDTLGATSSSLNDVAIINDTLAYAVGEMYLRDSTGQIDPILYNLAKWNGQQWVLKRVTVMYRGSPITPSLNAIFAFSPNDIWLSSGVPIHGDGQNWTQYHLFDMGILTQNDGSINKILGNSSVLWFVGNRGTIVSYTSGTWRRVESGTTGNLVDVWGFTNPSNGNAVVFAVGGTSIDVRLLSLSPSGVHDTLSWYSTLSIGSIWTVNKFRTYVSGVGVWRYRHPTWHPMEGVPQSIFFRRVRGSTDNNIAAVGRHGALAHFNGVSWQMASEIASSSYFESVAVSQNMLVAAGYAVSGFFSDRALIIIGRR